MSAASKVVLLGLLIGARGVAQEPAITFKLGTFEHQGRAFVGIVLPSSTGRTDAPASAALPPSMAVGRRRRSLHGRVHGGPRRAHTRSLRQGPANGTAPKQRRDGLL